MEDQELTIDLLEVYDILRKNAANIARVTGICVLAAGAYLLVASPTYESTSLLRVKQPKGIGSSLLESMPMGNAMASKQLMSTYAEILKSRTVIVPVIEQTEKADDEGRFPAYEVYVESRVATVPVNDTEIMQLTVRAKTAEDAQRANDLLVQTFLKRLTVLSQAEQSLTRAFLEERIKGAKAELDVAEDRLTAFKKDNKIIAPSDEVKLAADKMGMVDKLKAENQVAAATANARLGAANSQLGTHGSSLADNAVIASYNAKLTQLEAARISYADKYTAKHPKMIEVNQEIAELKAKIAQEAGKIAALQAPSNNPVQQKLMADKLTGEAEASVANSNLAALAELERENKEKIADLSEKEQAYVGLLRDAKVAGEIYSMLAKRVEEAKIAEAGVVTEVQVVDSATLPEKPVSPRKGLTLLLAALLGMFASAGFTVVRALMNRTIKTSEDVESYLGLPVLGQVPDYESLQKRMQEDEKPEGFIDKLKGMLWK